MFEKLRENLEGFITKISKSELSEKDLDKILWDFKLNLMENDVAILVADYICDEIKNQLIGLKIGRLQNRIKIVKDKLKEIILKIIEFEGEKEFLNHLETKISQRKPCIIIFLGINGTGKTTTIAKIANYLLKKKFSVVLASSDTFRAGSIEQLEIHAKRLGVPIIKHQYGGDAAAVAYDAIEHAKAKGINVVLIDTAGRMQTNKNLLMEIKKIVRVVNPDLTIFVGDALAGNDVVFQAEEFNKTVKIDGSILTKIDADVKGGAAISITYVMQKPIFFVGTGQKYEDLEPFRPEIVTKNLFSNN